MEKEVFALEYACLLAGVSHNHDVYLLLSKDSPLYRAIPPPFSSGVQLLFPFPVAHTLDLCLRRGR